jgi:hypothetical protein
MSRFTKLHPRLDFKAKIEKDEFEHETNISVDFVKLISGEKLKTQHNRKRFKSRSNQE